MTLPLCESDNSKRLARAPASRLARAPASRLARALASLIILTTLATIIAGTLAGCAKKEKRTVGSGRGALLISNSEAVLDPRFTVFLAKAYFAVASRREATNRIVLIKKGRRAQRGDVVEPEEVKRGRKLTNDDLAWIREQRQKLISLLATISGGNTAMFATAALAQANFDCWYFEMYKKPLLARNSSCGLDLAAALGSASDREQGDLFQARKNLPQISGQQSRNKQQGFATGQQFSALQRYLEKSDIDTLLMFLREEKPDMRGVVERLVEQQLEKTAEGIPLPFWQVKFPEKKRKLNKAGRKTIKQIAEWYKKQQAGVILRIEAAKIDDERVEVIVQALTKNGLEESDIVRDSLAQTEQQQSLAGEINIRAQRLTQ